MGTISRYWKKQSKVGREQFAAFIGTSVAYIELRYVCGKAKNRQRPSSYRMALMIEGSNGKITEKGLAKEFVIEPVREIMEARN